MVGTRYYAHSLPNQLPDKWQSLEEHLREVAKRAAEFAMPFGSADWAHNAGWLHDLGKATNAFQSYLLKSNGLDDSEYDADGSVSNHASAGAAFAEEKPGLCAGRILAYLAAGHHAGLPDWHTAQTGNAALLIRLQEGRENLGRIQEYADSVAAKLLATARPPEFARKPENVHLWIRMLFSCLVDADFLDTEVFMSPEQTPVRTGFKTLAELKPVFDDFMSRKTADAPNTEVNAIRREILAACRAAAPHQPGLFSLTVPTGGGKTLSSIAFALDHAVEHVVEHGKERITKKRIIYVIPYTSIIEQTAQVLADIFGPENVIEHHSNLDPEKETQRSRLASENWDAPIIVTTNVQFFESLYAAKSSRCRKLHNIVNSVVILDEAQLLPPNLLDPCVDVINQLTRHYGVTMVLSTATQPAPRKLDKPTEIIPPELNLYARLKRTEFNLPDLKTTSTWPDIAEQLKQPEQVLCIVNTRRDCYDLFKLMPEGTVHLSALMCGAHRSRIIRYIKWRLKKRRPLRVISTQLVEAGVDIDFPVVFRALAGLDSIAQAAGRCNREGKLNADGKIGQVHVFVPPKPIPSGSLRKGEDTTRDLCSIAGFDLHQPAIFTRYFDLFYRKINDTGTRFHDYLVKDANPNLAFQFRTAAQDFKLIDDQAQRPVLVRYRDSAKWIKQVRAVGPKREIMRKLQRYTVNLSVWMAGKMRDNGLLEEIYPGILAQTMSSQYNDQTGLDIYKEGLPIEDLMV